MTARFAQPLYQLAAAAAMAFAIVASSTAHAQSGPFSGLGGPWAGSGHVYLTNGTHERIRCRANYTVADDGNVLKQRLRCASDSYNFQFSSYVQNMSNGTIAGTWSEHTRSIGGMISGHVRRGHIDAKIKSTTLTADLNLVFRRNRQYVTIRSGGGGFEGAKIVLARR